MVKITQNKIANVLKHFEDKMSTVDLDTLMVMMEHEGYTQPERIVHALMTSRQLLVVNRIARLYDNQMDKKAVVYLGLTGQGEAAWEHLQKERAQQEAEGQEVEA